MKELKEMSREELLEVIRIKDILITELREELDISHQLAQQLQEKIREIQGNK